MRAAVTKMGPGTRIHTCSWPGCDWLAVTQCRTAILPWMRLCTEHRREWDTLPYPELVSVVSRAEGSSYPVGKSPLTYKPMLNDPAPRAVLAGYNRGKPTHNAHRTG